MRLLHDWWILAIPAKYDGGDWNGRSENPVSFQPVMRLVQSIKVRCYQVIRVVSEELLEERKKERNLREASNYMR